MPEITDKSVLDIKLDDFTDLQEAMQSIEDSPSDDIDDPKLDFDFDAESELQDLASPTLDLDSMIGDIEEPPPAINLTKAPTDTTTTTTDNDNDDDDDDDEPLKLKQVLKPLTFIIIAILIITFFYVAVFNKKSETTTTTTTTQATQDKILTTQVASQVGTSLYQTDALSYEPTQLTDYLIVSKNLFIWNNSAYPVISGVTTKGLIPVEIFVTMSTYNSLEDGDIVTVYYNDFEFNGQHYSTNYSLGEVIGK